MTNRFVQFFQCPLRRYMQIFKFLTRFNHPRGKARIKESVPVESKTLLDNQHSYLLQRFSLCFPVAIVRNTARLQLLPLFSWQPSQSFDTPEYVIDKEKTLLPGIFFLRKAY